MTHYENLIKTINEKGSEFWWSDEEMSVLIKYLRRNISHIRDQAVKNGYAFDVKMDKLPNNSYVFRYRHNPNSEVGGYFSVDEIKEPIASEQLEALRYRLISENSLATLEALIAINEGYWTMAEMAERLYCPVKQAKHRVYCLMSANKKAFYVHSRVGDNKRREYLAVGPEHRPPKAKRRTGKVPTPKLDPLIAKIFS